MTSSDQRARGVLTADAVLAWVADGAGTAEQPVETLLGGTPATVAPGASVADGVLAMGAENADAVAITSAFGGGGHARAAGCTVSAPLDEAMRLVLNECERELDRADARGR